MIAAGFLVTARDAPAIEASNSGFPTDLNLRMAMELGPAAARKKKPRNPPAFLAAGLALRIAPEIGLSGRGRDPARRKPLGSGIVLAQAGARVVRDGDAVDAPATEAESLLRGVTLSLGPLRWGGRMVSEYRLNAPGGQRRSTSFIDSGNLGAATYIFQPWFAQVSGAIGAVRSRSSGGDSSNKQASIGLTGDASVSLFPASRFPFSAYFNVSDSRTSGEFVGTDFRSNRFGLRQSYRDLDNTQYSARYERSALSGGGFGTDVVNLFDGVASKRLGDHSFEVNANASRNTGGDNGAQSDLARMSGRHSYAPAGNLSVQTLASFNRSRLERQSAGLDSLLTNRFVQFASFGSWRPGEGDPLYDEDHPLYFTGGLRFSGTSIQSRAAAAESQNFSLNAGASYSVTPQTRASASASVNQSAAGTGPSAFSSAQSVSVVHGALPIRFGEYTYTWNLGGSGNNSMASGGQPGQYSVSGQGSHNVFRGFAISEASRLNISVGQGIGSSFGSGAGSQSLSHNANLTWSTQGQGAGQGYVSLSAADSRSFGATRSAFQLVNLQATRQAPINPVSYWTGNLTVQGTRQNTPAASDGPPASADRFNFTTSGNLSYQHTRAFGFPRLRFFASYSAYQAQLQSRALGDIDAPRVAITDALDARFDYRIGKVATQLALRTATTSDDKRNSALFLRVERQF